MKSLALTWGSVGEGAERFEDEEVGELTTFRNLMAIEVVDGEGTLKPDNGLQKI